LRARVNTRGHNADRVRRIRPNRENHEKRETTPAGEGSQKRVGDTQGQ